MADLPVILGQVGAGLGAGSAVVIAYAALRGLKTWRTELQGAKQLETIEQALEGMYATRTAITMVRSPTCSKAEQDYRDNWPKSAGEITLKRLNEHQEAFDKMLSMRARVKLYLGPSAVSVLDDLTTLLIDISRAAHLHGMWAKVAEELHTAGQSSDKERDRRQKCLEVIWAEAAENDLVQSRLDDIVSRLENLAESLSSHSADKNQAYTPAVPPDSSSTANTTKTSSAPSK